MIVSRTCAKCGQTRDIKVSTPKRLASVCKACSVDEARKWTLKDNRK